MSQTGFDTFGYFEKLTLAGVPEEQAKIQANAFREFFIVLEENARKELATKGDARETELRLYSEIKNAELSEPEFRLLQIFVLAWEAVNLLQKGVNQKFLWKVSYSRIFSKKSNTWLDD